MTYYADRPKDLLQDTKNFLNSEYGKYIVSTLQEVAEGHLANAANMSIEHPERYAAKYSAVKEALNLIYAPLDANS